MAEKYQQAVGGCGTKEGAKAAGLVRFVGSTSTFVRSFVVYLPVRSKIRLAAGARGGHLAGKATGRAGRRAWNKTF